MQELFEHQRIHVRRTSQTVGIQMRQHALTALVQTHEVVTWASNRSSYSQALGQPGNKGGLSTAKVAMQGQSAVWRQGCCQLRRYGGRLFRAGREKTLPKPA
jgi:hypothetical protein